MTQPWFLHGAVAFPAGSGMILCIDFLPGLIGGMMLQIAARYLRTFAAAVVIVPFCLAAPVLGQDDAFENGWILQPEASSLRFQSVKNGSVVETSSFATFTGTISESGEAMVQVLLDSVDTTIDLRNVRMRFLFFETFQFPEAVITAQLDPAMLSDLAERRRMTMQLPYTLDLHGVSQDRVAEVSVTLISSDMVAISTISPISIAVADFNLTAGITKLQEAANVQIVPTGGVTFDFLFERVVSGGEAPLTDDDPIANVAADPVDEPVSAAVETQGNFDTEACVGRFEILSRAGNITFRSASAQLDAASNALLDNLYDIVRRCPGMIIEVGGHTDSDGSDATNLALSERRAAAVIEYLAAKGIEPERMVARGYGEAMPIVPNTSSENKARNRRIEFQTIVN